MLALIWCEMNTCSRDIFLSMAQEFYKPKDVAKAEETLFARTDQRDNETPRINSTKTGKILYTTLRGIPTENPHVFVAFDLKKILCVNLNKTDEAALVRKQNETKHNLSVSGH